MSAVDSDLNAPAEVRATAHQAFPTGSTYHHEFLQHFFAAAAAAAAGGWWQPRPVAHAAMQHGIPEIAPASVISSTLSSQHVSTIVQEEATSVLGGRDRGCGRGAHTSAHVGRGGQGNGSRRGRSSSVDGWAASDAKRAKTIRSSVDATGDGVNGGSGDGDEDPSNSKSDGGIWPNEDRLLLLNNLKEYLQVREPGYSSKPLFHGTFISWEKLLLPFNRSAIKTRQSAKALRQQFHQMSRTARLIDDYMEGASGVNGWWVLEAAEKDAWKKRCNAKGVALSISKEVYDAVVEIRTIMTTWEPAEVWTLGSGGLQRNVPSNAQMAEQPAGYAHVYRPAGADDCAGPSGSGASPTVGHQATIPFNAGEGDDGRKVASNRRTNGAAVSDMQKNAELLEYVHYRRQKRQQQMMQPLLQMSAHLTLAIGAAMNNFDASCARIANMTQGITGRSE